jgi:hypothetical protein
MSKELTRDIVLMLIVIAGLVSFFYNPMMTDMRPLQILVGGIIGYYTGNGSVPIMGAIKK